MKEICIGPIDQIPIGGGREFRFDGHEFAVFRTTDNRLFATQALCPHANGHLADGLLGMRRIICPQHQWKFDLETGECVGGEPSRLRTYKVELRDGMIVVIRDW